MEIAHITLTLWQAHQWIRALKLAPAQRRVMRAAQVGDILVFSDWTTGRVEATIVEEEEEETHD